MILEVAILDVIPGKENDFQIDFAKAQLIISSMKGYLNHELKRCIENPSRYILMVNWETLEDHTEGFRGSSAYQEWKQLLHHYYDPFPVVEHYESLSRGLETTEGFGNQTPTIT
ncbi:antibiotic biosynthesis monooxygenase [Spirulina sp. 06S082]|uniref:antibiotic biosynthesis monooxygenase family protein n=1 Tax=Spirulina sp. 06S082 TaxID=3110248 RepID=UPI002B20E10C|nr:antibiotic biosynthesis monooxygenase [Spirulina sp. 06S082]MEA5468252.1 antibiotic biosynthesis monooxygenase [Spirulina sp. 06S082]